MSSMRYVSIVELWKRYLKSYKFTKCSLLTPLFYYLANGIVFLFQWYHVKTIPIGFWSVVRLILRPEYALAEVCSAWWEDKTNVSPYLINCNILLNNARQNNWMLTNWQVPDSLNSIYSHERSQYYDNPALCKTTLRCISMQRHQIWAYFSPFQFVIWPST